MQGLSSHVYQSSFYKMESSLPDLDRILFTDLRPLQQKDKPRDWFTHMLARFTGEPLIFKVIWEADFIHAVHNMLKYYKVLIDSQCNRYYNQICSEMLQAGTTQEKEFMLTVVLNKVLAVKLNETAREIIAAKADPEILTGGQPWQQEQNMDWEQIYILHYLKLKLIALYLNIQDRYSVFLKGDKFTAADLELKYFRGIPSGPGTIQLAEASQQPMEPVKVAGGIDPAKDKKMGKDEFDPIVKQPRFLEIVDRLKEYGILDSEGCFINSKKKSHKTLLSAVFRAMMDSGFFRKNIPPSKRLLKESDILSYLEKRFHVELKETFRKITPAQMEESRKKLPWLDGVR